MNDLKAKYVELTLCETSLDYKVGDIVNYQNDEWVVENVVPKRHLVLRRRNP